MVNFVPRSYWIQRIEDAWNQKSIIWLSGVRRAGKTLLTQSLRDVEYFDCELPRVRRLIEDPEDFLRPLRGKRIALDEIHRLNRPAELLKIAADHYPDISMIATGSSTLGASSKFRDTLAGRKRSIWLTPMISEDLKYFENDDLKHRLLRGGLPPFFAATRLPEKDFQEWMDAFWAKDIQELFRLEKRYAFQKFLELTMIRSGGIFEATKFTDDCEASRGTIKNYLNVLEATYLAHIIRPFSSRRATEIVSAPKVYAFDTGFICYYRGWHELRSEDLGILWEHFVLNEIHAKLQTRDIHYWRNKRGQEIDFVLIKRGGDPIAIECKWTASDLNPAAFQTFRSIHSKGLNFVVAIDIDRSYGRTFGDLSVSFVSLADLIRRLLQ